MLRVRAPPARTVRVAAARKQNQKPPPPDGDRAAPPPPPPRIIDTSRVGLKKQKKLVAALRAAENSGGGGGGGASNPVARKFRRAKPDKEAMAAAAAAEAARDAAARGTTVSLRGLYGSRGAANPPVLLVDGYNIAFYAARLGPSAVRSGVPPATRAALAAGGAARTSLDGARQALLHDMCEYSCVAGVKIVVAWDAMHAAVAPPPTAALGTAAAFAPAPAPGLARANVAGVVDVVYCGDRDADAFLIAEARRLAAEGAPQVVVASSDREIQLSLDFSVGTGFVPAGTFLKEVTRTLAANDKVVAVKAATSQVVARRLGAGGGSTAARLVALKERLLREQDAERERKKKEKEGKQ